VPIGSSIFVHCASHLFPLQRCDVRRLTSDLRPFSGSDASVTPFGKSRPALAPPAPQGDLTVSGTRLYGMTESGGSNFDPNGFGWGNVFSVGVNGTNFQNILSFTGTSGSASGGQPYGDVTVVGTSLYGMTPGGGTDGVGNVFSVGTDGTGYQNLVSFSGTGGAASGYWPYGSLTIAGTSLYGMTQRGGTDGQGNLFSVGTNGSTYQNLVSFAGSGGTANGSGPFGSLTLAGSTLYGMTGQGGRGFGNVFSIGTNGSSYDNLYSMTGGTGGDNPAAALLLSGTTLYGTTVEGGAYDDGNVFSVGVNGTNYHNLVSFTRSGGTANGYKPGCTLVLSGTTLYGLTAMGGTHGLGNILSVGIDGSDYQDLYDFSGGTSGAYPWGSLTLSGGTLFGLTSDQEIANSNGTIFAYTLPTLTPEPCTLALAGVAAAVLLGANRWWTRRPRRGNRAPPALAPAPSAPTAPPSRA
jgi:hypothetical protein